MTCSSRPTPTPSSMPANADAAVMFHPGLVAKRQHLPFRAGVSKLDPASAPSSVDLLYLRHVFSQADLLTERQLRAAAKERGVSIDRNQLARAASPAPPTRPDALCA
jgi:hypothetical protein